MATITPNWTTTVSLAPQLLTKGNLVSTAIDLTGKFKARVFVRVARTGAAALTNGLAIRIRANLGSGKTNPWPVLIGNSSSAAAATVTSVIATSGLGQSNTRHLMVASIVGFSANSQICLFDTALTRLEFLRVASVASDRLVVDSPMIYTHTDVQSDIITNRTDHFQFDLEGGTIWNVLCDYSDDVSGDALIVEIITQSYNSQTSV